MLVTLTGVDSLGATVSLTTTTDASGLYTFTNLVPGTYTVTVTAPAGYLVTARNQGEPDADSDAGSGGAMVSTILTSGEADLTWDAGLYRPATLGDRVWQDTNSDGLQTSGEAGFADVTITLDGRTGAGATVTLTTTTDASGFYTFTTLAPGVYTVTVTAPDGYVFTQRHAPQATAATNSDADSTGVMDRTTLTSGEEDLSWDAGLYQRSSLGDRAWDDRNANGIQDEGELGVAGVAVTLYAADGTTVMRTTTTDSDGLYRFDELEPGNYIIGFGLPDGFVRSITGGTSDQALDSDADQSTGLTSPITLPTATSDLTWDAGIYQPAQLGDLVWLDRNANGLQDVGETGLANVVVTLFGEDGTTVISTTMTNENGIYQFTYLDPGIYSIEFTPPAGYELSPQGQGDDAAQDSDADPLTGRTESITLEPGQSDQRYDAGLFQRVAVGDRVWLDLNNNGLIDPDEQGLENIEVLLYTDRDNDGLPDGAAIASTTTDAQGNYRFAQLVPGDYLVEIIIAEDFTSSTGLPGSATGPYEPAPSPNDDRDHDDNGTQVSETLIRSGTITLWSQQEPGEAMDGDDFNGNMTLDFGIFHPASLGQGIWYDTNGNGYRDPGEAGVPDVLVTLYYGDGAPVLGPDGRPITMVTDENGLYRFDYLVPGTYLVGFTNLPPGYTFTVPGGDSNTDPVTGQTIAVTLAPGDINLTLWAGLVSPTAIKLVQFTATPASSGISLNWTTAAEQSTWGFHILRSLDTNPANAVRITDQTILARGNPQMGASYSWTDTTAVPGTSYNYWLEESELDGTLNTYGPATATMPLSEMRFRVVLPLIMR